MTTTQTQIDAQTHHANPAPDALPAHFAPGDRVRVRAAVPPGHIRTPRYCRGKIGTVERLCGAFANPEELAFNRPGLPRQPLYRVRFHQCDVWPAYQGAAQDTLDIELYQHWLDPVRDPLNEVTP